MLVFFGSNTPNNQPVTTKYIHYAKKQGTKVLVVNPFDEPGFQRYWIPSDADSAVLGTALADEFFRVHTGGDLAFLLGVVKALIASRQVDASFIDARTTGFEELRQHVDSLSWQTLEHHSGASQESIERFAHLIGEAKSGVFVWSMGVTQHRHGVDTVRAIVNLALARGFIGREKCGLMPIRGHSGVQGGAEVGAIPNAYGMDSPVGDEGSARLADIWRFQPPTTRGLNAVETIQAAHDGGLDALYSIGGNYLETLPDPDYVEKALRNVPLRIHQDITLASHMFVEPNETVVLLPAKTRYEQDGGGTETTTERRIIFSPEIQGHHVGEAKSEWEIPLLIAQQIYPERADLIRFDNADAIRDEIARVVPAYDGIQHLAKKGDMVQWGGARLGEGGVFPTADKRARFSPVPLPENTLAEGYFFVSTRRGKQFNSMVHRETDPLTGAKRLDALMSADDAERLQVKDGDAIQLKNAHGEMLCRVRISPILPRNIQVHWPEGNVLIPPNIGDPECGVPDYNATVQITPL